MKKSPFVIAATAALCSAVPVAADAQSLNDLACAAGVHCHGTPLTSEEVRLVLGMDSQYEAEKAFINASRDFPDSVWRCAAAGECSGSLTQSEARVLIPLPDEALALAEVRRRRQAQPEPEPAILPADTPAARPHAKPAAKPSGGIDVEVNQPGPREIDLRKPSSAGGSGAGDIQPQDGVWHFAFGRTGTSGQCLPGIAAGVAGQMPAPKSGAVTFQRPFNAGQIIPNPQVKWTRIGPNHWRGTLAASQGTPLQMSWDIRVTSTTRMAGETTVRVSVPSLCTISTPFTFHRQ